MENLKVPEAKEEPKLVKTELKEASEKPAVVEVPKNKAEWDKLRTEDPIKWGELTQANTDAIFRQKREAEEQLARERAEKQNLQAELDRYRKPPVVEVADQPKIYGPGNYPQTEEEWNDLFLEKPILATDLRNQYLNTINVQQSEFVNTRKKSVETLISEHPDMYHYEVDGETGKAKLDAGGKPIVAKDPKTGLYAFNPDSEKGKLWVEIFNEDPQGWAQLKNAPELMMAQMERRLRVNGARVVNGQNKSIEQDQSGVLGEGVPAPRASSLKFASDEEKAHAQGAVSRGTYKSLDEYVQLRDKGNTGYTEPNSRPNFTKK